MRQGAEYVVRYMHFQWNSVKLKKTSLKNVNKTINEEIKSDFMVVYNNDRKYIVLKIVDFGTKYGESRDIIAKSSKYDGPNGGRMAVPPRCTQGIWFRIRIL